MERIAVIDSLRSKAANINTSRVKCEEVYSNAINHFVNNSFIFSTFNFRTIGEGEMFDRDVKLSSVDINIKNDGNTNETISKVIEENFINSLFRESNEKTASISDIYNELSLIDDETFAIVPYHIIERVIFTNPDNITQTALHLGKPENVGNNVLHLGMINRTHIYGVNISENKIFAGKCFDENITYYPHLIMTFNTSSEDLIKTIIVDGLQIKGNSLVTYIVE